MSYTLYLSPTATSDLIAQPGRAVSTFPSGLVRVDQTYLGLTANATTHRAILAVGNDMPDGDTSPCIDGLKIFPEAQERRREDGMTEYIVSAYGRTKTTPTIEKTIKIFESAVLSPAYIVRNSVTATIVAGDDVPTESSLALDSSLFSPASAVKYDTGTGTALDATITLVHNFNFLQSWNFAFSDGTDYYRLITYAGRNYGGDDYLALPLSLSRRNFGYWNEWIFAYG